MPFKYETEKRKDNRGQPYARKQLPNWNSLPILRAHCRLVQIFGIKRHKLPFIIILYIKYIYIQKYHGICLHALPARRILK